MRGLCLLLFWGISGMAVAADGLQAVLDRHVRTDVAYWLEEPRLTALLRETSRRNAGLDEAALGSLDARWQAELAGEGGELSDYVASRFASNYLAEVALRLDGAYGPLLLLDTRGLVTAASELPERMLFTGDRCMTMLASRADAAWVQDRRPVTGAYTRVALPVRDTDGTRIGTLLFDVDVSRLPAGRLAGDDTRRRDDSALSSSITRDNEVVR
ncbi:MAG: hypothetical protein ACOY33_10700 [Pseudomonadota bacterium]